MLVLFKECRNIRNFIKKLHNNINKTTINLTLGRTLHSKKLKDLLEQHHKIILWGEHGSGKTQFIKYCLHTWNKTNFCFVDYNFNLSVTLQEVKYTDFLDTPFDNFISDVNKYNFQTSLLIIDNMFRSSNMANDIKELAKLNIDMIIISAKQIDTDDFYSFELPQLSDDDLQNIFENESNFIPPVFSISKKQETKHLLSNSPMFPVFLIKFCYVFYYIQ